MAHLAVLVCIRDRTRFECRHGLKGRREAGPQVLKLSRVQPHPADIQPEPHRLAVPEQRAEALPLALGIDAGSG